MGKTLTFQAPEQVPRRRDATQYRFPFRLVDSELIGAPEELARSTSHVLTVGVSGTLEACWGVPENLLPRILFEYGKRHLKQKVLDHALSESEELLLHSGNAETRCPFDPDRIADPSGTTLKIEDTVKPLMEDPSLLKLASRIIDARDNINAIFHEKHGEKLIVVREERDLLQFFRDASSAEEFFYRVCALANAATGWNLSKLRDLTKITDSETKLIGLLDAYLTRKGLKDEQVVKTLRALNNLRQGYPVHGDRSEGVLRAHAHLGLPYPVLDYSEAWKRLLVSYLGALERLLARLKGESTSQQGLSGDA